MNIKKGDLKMEKLTVYIKDGKNYIENYSTTDATRIYQLLTNDLISKKINCCKWIKSIKRENLYNGYQKITVFQENGGKSEYIIKD
jgi:hypothetical protein